MALQSIRGTYAALLLYGVPPVSRTPGEWALSRLEGSPVGRTREIGEEVETQVQ